MDNESMICTSCQNPKHHLNARHSKLIADKSMYLCDECDRLGYEPRWIVVMAARWFGPATVSDYLKNHKYVGNTITAQELI